MAVRHEGLPGIAGSRIHRLPNRRNRGGRLWLYGVRRALRAPQMILARLRGHLVGLEIRLRCRISRMIPTQDWGGELVC